MTARSAQWQELHDLVEPVVSAAGYELVDLSVTAAGRRSLVRVTVDTVDTDAGIDLDGVAVVSRAVSEALDDETRTAFAGPFVLEVSSPGVDRPLSEPRHYRRAVGRLVSVPVSGTEVTGRVLSAGDALRLELDGTPRDYQWDQVGTGRMQVEFTRPGQPDGQADETADDASDEED
jgi:ribosome maturation factor RimP